MGRGYLLMVEFQGKEKRKPAPRFADGPALPGPEGAPGAGTTPGTECGLPPAPGPGFLVSRREGERAGVSEEGILGHSTVNGHVCAAQGPAWLF